jgi:hypothetical protein
MSAELQWAAAYLNGETVLTCGHAVAVVADVGDAVYCEECIWPFEVRLDQELAAAGEPTAA